MGSLKITDKDVVYQIAQILVREISGFQKANASVSAADIDALVERGASPLMTYKSLADELNLIFSLESAEQKFTALNVDPFLGILLRESVDFAYKIDGVFHKGKIRKKIGCDLPITAIVVNGKTNIPGRQFFGYFSLPRANDPEMRRSTCVLLEALFAYKRWDDYLNRVDKVFGRK